MNYKRTPLALNNGKAEIITIQTNHQNSLTKANMVELGEILMDIKKDDSIKGIIIDSENPKFFCNGLDAETLLNTPDDQLVDAVGGICILFGEFLKFDKPISIEISGHSMGGGAVITVTCDYKFMLEGAGRIGFTEVMVGLPLPGMFVYRIQELVPPSRIREVTLEGGTFKPQEAKTVGIIDEVASSREELRSLSIKKLDNVFKLPMSAIRFTKENLNRRSLEDFEIHLKNSKSWLEIPVVRQNLKEAMLALQEKRRPKLI
jgi:enoyl-CoA hydratase/carnithine racemase